MILHIVEARGERWAVVAKGRRLSADRVVSEHDSYARAREAMQKLNAAQMGRPAADVIGAAHVRAGCTCGRGVALPGDPPCPVHP